MSKRPVPVPRTSSRTSCPGGGVVHVVAVAVVTWSAWVANADTGEVVDVPEYASNSTSPWRNVVLNVSVTVEPESPGAATLVQIEVTITPLPDWVPSRVHPAGAVTGDVPDPVAISTRPSPGPTDDGTVTDSVGLLPNAWAAATNAIGCAEGGTVTCLVIESVSPPWPVTVSLTLYVPAAANACEIVAPVPVVPSPKSHE